MPDRCPHCHRPVLRVVEQQSTITWVHEMIRSYIFGCTRSKLERKAA